MMTATFTVGAETANARDALVQLGSRQTRGASVRSSRGKRAVEMYLSSDSAGDTVVNPAAAGVVPTAGAAGKLLQAHVASEQPLWQMRTDSDGKVNVVLTNSGDADTTVYLNVKDPGTGKVTTSPAITFVDDTP